MVRSLLRSTGAVVMLCLAASAGPSQGPPKESPRMAEVRFADGSVVRMNIMQESIEVTTKYGKLSIPTDDVRRIEMGLHIPPGIEQQIDSAIRNLSSEAFK